ncbi:unnamed protein product, partial [Pleuronectes platessa]
SADDTTVIASSGRDEVCVQTGRVKQLASLGVSLILHSTIVTAVETFRFWIHNRPRTLEVGYNMDTSPKRSQQRALRENTNANSEALRLSTVVFSCLRYENKNSRVCPIEPIEVLEESFKVDKKRRIVRNIETKQCEQASYITYCEEI